MSAPVGPIMQQLATLPARSRQGLNNLRQRLFQQGTFSSIPRSLPFSFPLEYITHNHTGEKPKTEGPFLRTSLSAHRPVWMTAGGGVYTSMAAVYLTMRYMRRLR